MRLTTIESMAENIAYHSGCVLTGMNLKRTDDGWLVILKVKDRKGKPQVSFVHGATLDEAFAWIETCLTTTSHSLKWREDRFGT